MTTITLNKKVFEDLVDKKFSTEELKEKIPYLGVDLESINQNEFTIEVFPNRPDLLSEQGFARAFSSFIDIKKGLKKYKVTKSPYRVKIDSSVNQVRPYTACAIVKNLKFDNEKIREVIQIQEKLHLTYGRNRKKAAIGIYPFEKIKTPIFYKALPQEKIKFQPLESDKEMTAIDILNKHPAGKEYGHLLENYKNYPVFIDANNNILSMPPIINSNLTGKITEKTKEVFIECSGHEFNTLKTLLNIIVTALADIGGEIYSMELYYENKKEITPDLTPSSMNLNLSYVNRLLGLELTLKDIKELLERMGYSYNKKVLIPAYRSDILHPMDLVEDIAIAYGYNNFEPEIPKVATNAGETELSIFTDKLREILIGLGLLETSTFIITAQENETKSKLNNKLAKIINPINKEFNILRSSLMPSALQILSENQHYEYPQKIFEINKVFNYDNERVNLIIALCHEKANFTEIHQILDALLSNLTFEYSLEPPKEDLLFIEGRTALIKIKNKIIGKLGETNPEILMNWNLQMPVSLLELNINLLYGLIT